MTKQIAHQLDVVEELYAQGYAMTLLHPKSKRPVGENWNKFPLCLTELRRGITAGKNVGIILNAPLVDVDLDAPEAVQLAARFLPPTGMVHGRESKRRSHYWYHATPNVATLKFQDIPPHSKMLLELRGSGHQTMAPGSVHPSGEIVEFAEAGEPASVDGSYLKRCCNALAVASLLARHWPSKGARHDTALALAGCLARAEWDLESSTRLFDCILSAVDDEERESRLRDCAGTYAKFARGAPVTGISKLTELLGGDVTKKLRNWIFIDESLSNSKEEVILGVDEHRCIDQVIEGLAQDTSIFQFGGKLVQISQTRDGYSNDQKHDIPKLRAISPEHLRVLITRNVKLKALRKGKPIAVHPPPWLINGTFSLGNWPPIRSVRMLANSPLFVEVGGTPRLHMQRGYDAASRVYVGGPDIEWTIPPAPTQQQVCKAMDILHDVIQDFPFKTTSDRSAFLAALITVAARPAICGPVPMFVLDSNQQGSGKGLLCDVIGLITLSREIPRSTVGNNEEMRKLITSVVLDGARAMMLDNVTESLKLPALAAALTTMEWRDRVLGSNTLVTGTLQTVWFTTANNATFDRDTARRIVPIRLACESERPDLREDFKYPNLQTEVCERRQELLTAALTLVQGYIAAGMPQQKLEQMGSFGPWRQLVPASLVWAGQVSPLQAREDFIATGDVESDALKTLLTGMHDAIGSKAVTASDLMNLFATGSSLEEAAYQLRPQANGRRLNVGDLAMIFRKIADRGAGGYVLRRGGKRQNTVLWVVQTTQIGVGR